MRGGAQVSLLVRMITFYSLLTYTSRSNCASLSTPLMHTFACLLAVAARHLCSWKGSHARSGV